MKKLETADEVITALGRTGEVAKLMGRSVESVCNWRRRGQMPAELYPVIADRLATMGLEPSPDLFGAGVSIPLRLQPQQQADRLAEWLAGFGVTVSDQGRSEMVEILSKPAGYEYSERSEGVRRRSLRRRRQARAQGAA